MQVLIDVPDDVVNAIKLPIGEIPMRLKVELAVRLYRKGLLGYGKSRELSGLSAWEFQELLGKENICRTYDIEELSEDLNTLEKLF